MASTESKINELGAAVIRDIALTTAEKIQIIREPGSAKSKSIIMAAHIFIRGVPKKFGEWYQKTNKTEDTNKLTLLAFKIITILHNTLLATFIMRLGTVGHGRGRRGWQDRG
jgi:hypothetical protein